MSGHEEDQLTAETFERTDKLVKTLEGLIRQVPLDASPIETARKDTPVPKPLESPDPKESQEGEGFSCNQGSERSDIRKDETRDQLAGNAVVQAIDVLFTAFEYILIIMYLYVTIALTYNINYRML